MEAATCFQFVMCTSALLDKKAWRLLWMNDGTNTFMKSSKSRFYENNVCTMFKNGRRKRGVEWGQAVSKARRVKVHQELPKRLHRFTVTVKFKKIVCKSSHQHAGARECVPTSVVVSANSCRSPNLLFKYSINFTFISPDQTKLLLSCLYPLPPRLQNSYQPDFFLIFF